MGYIYRIFNSITGDSYIGKTTDTIEQRFHEHIKEANEALNGTRLSFPLFHRMIIKYGAENFYAIQLEECDDNKLDEREQFWIDYHDTFNNGYNSNIGGKTIGTKLYDHPHEVSQFTLTGKFIKTFSSVKEAIKEIKVHESGIRKNCNGDTSNCAGFLWQWGTDNTFNRDIPSKFRIAKI